MLVASPANGQTVGSRQAHVELTGLLDGVLAPAAREVTLDSLSLELPQNRRDSLTGSIRLPVLRLRAVNPDAPAIFWLGGGPGLSNLHTVHYDYFADDYDQVMVGYRGVDGSVSLECEEVV
jgi:hypothetical protein